MSQRVSASARVTVTVVVDCPSSWGTECTIDQIHKQASEEALKGLKRMLHGGDRIRATVIGEPVVQVVTTRPKEI